MIKLICIGKIKESYFQEAIKEYEKRLSKYTKLDIIELPDLDYSEIDRIRKEEAKLILKHLRPNDNVIVLDIFGQELDSLELTKTIMNLEQRNSNLTFIIGGSYGLSEEIKARANYHLSFSKLTFPHQLFRIIFLEQLYRTYKIRNNESYHKWGVNNDR